MKLATNMAGQDSEKELVQKKGEHFNKEQEKQSGYVLKMQFSCKITFFSPPKETGRNKRKKGHS